MGRTEYRAKLNPDPDAALLLLFGHGSLGTAETLATYSSISCVAADEWNDLEFLLSDRPLIGISAMSKPEQPGEAGRAIALFRRYYGDTELALYNAWDYNVRRAALRALEYDADGIIMPGIAVNDLIQCFITYLARVAGQQQRAQSPEEHEAILKPMTFESPFWKMQDRVVSPYF